MNRLTKFALKNPSVIIILTILIIVGGIYSAFGLRTEAMPDIAIPYVIVTTPYPGAAPNDVLQTVTKPLEKATASVKGLKVQESRSLGSVSLLILQFDFGVDMEAAESQVEKLVDAVSLPSEVQKPEVSRVSFSDSPILVMSISGENSPSELSKTVQDKIQSELASVAGVGKLDIQGMQDSNIYIKIDPDKLKSYGITLDSVQQALLANNISLPAGSLDMNHKSMPLQVSKQVTTVNDIKNIPIVVMPNTTKEMGNGLTQMGKAVSGLAQGMGSLGQGVQQLGQGVGDSIEGTALVAQIQLTQMQMTQLQGQLAAAGQAGANADQQTITNLQAQIQQQSTILAGLNQNLIEWLNQQKANTSKASTGSSLPSTGVVPKQLSSSDLQIKTVSLSDIADVSVGGDSPTSYTRTDSQFSVVINVIKDPDANTVQVAQDIQTKIDSIKPNLPQGTIFSILYDQSKDIKASINGMMREALLGALFAAVVIAFFLRNFTATIVAITSIPVSVLIALILLPRFNVTLNMMTIGGLAVAVGRVVDDAIVVIENNFRRYQAVPEEERTPDLVLEATKEVSTAITSSTITTVAVFAPLALVTGIISKFFYPFALTVVICLLASLLVAVTLVPLLSRYLLLKGKQKEERESRLQRLYQRVLGASLNHRWVVVVISIAIMGVSVWMTAKVPIQFIPADQTKALTMTLAMTPGTSLENTNQMAIKAEKILSDNKDVNKIEDTVGDSSSQMGMNFNMQGSDHAQFMVVLNEDADIDQTISDIRSQLKPLETNGVQMFVSALSTTAPSDSMEVIVNGPDIDAISQGATLITNAMKGITDLVNVENNLAVEKPQILVDVDAKKAGEQGYTPIQVAGLVRVMLTDTTVTTITQNDQTVDVMMSLKTDKLTSLSKIGEIQLQGANGDFYLKDIATIQEKTSPVSITQRDQKQFASITADILGHDTQGVTKQIETKIDSMKGQLPEGITYTLGGSNEQIQDGFSQMGIAIGIAIALVYLVMVVVFGGALVPLAILFSLPFAATGGLIALFIAHQSLSMPAMIGMLMLIGIVVTNAIVLVDRVQTNRKKGLSVNEALTEAGSVRLRPILMTAIATIMALIPLAAGFSEGTLISVTLGVVVIGGLTISTLLTLIVVPVAYSFFESLRRRILKSAE